MTISLETWHPTYWIIVINDSLLDTRIEDDFKGRDIKAFWGKEIYGDQSKEKLMYVWYPKNKYSEFDIRNRIIRQYDNCPLCKIGRDIQNSIFKYKKNNHKNNNNYRELGKKNMLEKVKSMIRSKSMNVVAPYGGQGAAALMKLPLSMITTDLGHKIITGIAGGLGNIANEYLNKNNSSKEFLRSLFCNLMYTPLDPSTTQMRAMKRQAGDLVSGMKYKSFKAFSGAIFEDPQEVVAAIKEWIPSFKGFKGLFSKKGGSYNRRRVIGTDTGITDVTPEHVSSYSSSEKMITY